MAPRGGYKQNTDARAEYVRVDRDLDADSKITARCMGQDYFVWVADALEHHIYRCETLLVQERYRADEMAARQTLRGTPDPNDSRYQVTRPKPTITRAQAGGSTTSTGPRARL